MCTGKLRSASSSFNGTRYLDLYGMDCDAHGLVPFETVVEVQLPSLRELSCGTRTRWLRIYAGVSRPWMGFVLRVSSCRLFVPERVLSILCAGVAFVNIPNTFHFFR